jgi:hypothetical protein
MYNESVHFAVTCIENMDQLFDEAAKQTDDCSNCNAGTIGIWYVAARSHKVFSVYRTMGNITDFNICVV